MSDGIVTDCPSYVSVADFLPLFRYAVGPASQHSPAIPFYTRKGAEECFAYVVRELPWSGAIMYRRTWRGLLTVREYAPDMQQLRATL